MCEIEESTVLLSLTTGLYYTLDEIGGLIWSAVVQRKPVDLIAREIVLTYQDERPDAIVKDVDALCRELHRCGLVEPAPAENPASSAESRLEGLSGETARFEHSCSIQRSPRPDRLRLPSVLECLIRLVAVHVLLRVRGLRTMVTIAHRRCVDSAITTAPAILTEFARRLRRAGLFYPFGAHCLENSLCLIWLAQKRGIRANLRIGVLPYPFQAHAWVEYGGVPVNENPEYLQVYRPFPIVNERSWDV